MCRFLLEHGADPYSTTPYDSGYVLSKYNTFSHVLTLYSNLTALELLLFVPDRYSFGDSFTLLTREVILCLLERTDISEDDWYWKYVGDHETLQLLITNFGCHPATFQERIDWALSLASRERQWDMASLVRVALGNNPINAEVARARDFRGRYLLQYAAAILVPLLDTRTAFLRGYGTCPTPGFDAEGNVRFISKATNRLFIEKIINGHLKYIRALIRADTQLYPHNSYYEDNQQISLLQLALGFDGERLLFYDLEDVIACMNTALKLWLTQLHVCNFNLQSYGEQEYGLFCNRPTEVDNDCPFVGPTDGWSTVEWKIRGLRCKRYDDVTTTHVDIRLAGFSYGPQVEDWKLWVVDEEMPSLFMEFWDMVDHPERAIPGAWQEDF